MGTFLGYYGNPTIPEDKHQEFTERVLKILDQGGMMDVETVSLFGRNVDLLQPPGVDDNGNVLFCCNYFENFVWETGLYRPATAQLHTNKVGTRQFNLVSRALYVLNEFYAETFGIAEEDGYIYNAQRTIGWLNELFDERYDNRRVSDLWEIYRLLPEYQRGDDLMRLTAGQPAKETCIQGFVTYFVIAGDAFEKVSDAWDMQEKEEDSGLLGRAVMLHHRIREFRTASRESDAAQLARMKELLAGQRCGAPLQGESEELGRLISSVPLEIAVKFVAVAFGLDFWNLLAEFELPEKRTAWRIPEGNYTPVSKVSTGEYLGTTDDDRAWWWKPGGNICFSDGMNGWLEERREEIRKLARMETIGSPELMRLLVDTLCCIQEDWNTMAFSSMFYDFLEHAKEPVVQGAVRSIGRLAQECREKPADGIKWLRRYLAVLGNFDLRKELFGF